MLPKIVTAVILIAIALALFFIIRKKVRDVKKGKYCSCSSCSGNCSSCGKKQYK